MNRLKKILLVFGTRPEAIKMAPVYHALRERSDVFEPLVCVTGQHRKMLDQVLDTFSIAPDIDLDVMRPGQDLYYVTSAILTGMRDVLRERSPDVVLVHGDTTTTMSTAMAAFYERVPLGHVEAGLRTRDLYSPFPEEFNRQVTSRVARWHFAPTATNRRNLEQEGVPDAHIHVTGNTVIDALLLTLRSIEADPAREARTSEALGRALAFPWRTSRYILVTGHRRESFGAGFQEICHALREIARRFPDEHIVYPVHLNPQVHGPVTDILRGVANVHLIDPLEYEPFLLLMKHCHFVLTDSGGIQEEAPSLGKPVLVMRDVTERPEAVEAGTVLLTGAHYAEILLRASELITDPARYASMSRAHNPYGDGSASARIADVLERELGAGASAGSDAPGGRIGA